MSLYIQSANSLVSQVSQWVGAIPMAAGVNATSFNASTGVLGCSVDPSSLISVGDFIGYSMNGPFTIVTGYSASTLTVDDPDDVWTLTTFPTAIYKLPAAASTEILACIKFAELKMRTLELPALRSDPYDPANPAILTVNAQGLAPIPADMNKPILFFQETPPTGNPPGSGLGPWIMYDRVGDREIIRRRMIDQLYVRPFGVPRVIRASFSEVGNNYVFTPNPGQNTQIKAYYYKTFPFLFGATGDVLEPLVQTNAVLSSFPEGYFYGSLAAYYDKNKNTDEAQKWNSRFDDSYGLIEDQNYKGKWMGGDQHLTSEFQPREYRYSFK